MLTLGLQVDIQVDFLRFDCSRKPRSEAVVATSLPAAATADLEGSDSDD